MRFRLLLLLLPLLAACSGPDASSTPTTGGLPAGTIPPTPRIVTAEQLDGDWVFGDGHEPAAGPVADCQALQTMTLQTVGAGRLHAAVQTCVQTCEQLESLDGIDDQGQVTLSGSFQGNFGQPPIAVSYTLRYDTATQHLVGTRNGTTFWAAPYEPSADCPPSPSPGPSPSPFNA